MTKKILYYLFIFLYLSYISLIVIFSANFGIINSYTNISNSMGPLIEVGSVVVVKSQDSYQVGDIISYYARINDQVTVVTHRITAIGGNVYITKGDANNISDRELVRPRLIVGKVIKIIPHLGYLLNFAKSSSGKIISIILPAVFILIIELRKIYRNLKLNEKD
jgi:signal peptidase I